MELVSQMKENLVELAKKSSDQSVLSELSKNVDSLVRKEVARNSFTPTAVLDILAMDCVANVSFMAVQNPKCNIEREISDNDHPCVRCTRNVLKIDCNRCKSLTSYRSVA